MPSIALYPGDSSGTPDNSTSDPLPQLLQTPSGLAILEIQGTIHAPFPEHVDEDDTSCTQVQTPVGRLEFPFYDPAASTDDTKWMKRVYLYVGKHQRLTGEVKKLPKALVVIGKRDNSESADNVDDMDIDGAHPPKDELEVLEVIRHKILFGGRPEPVGD